MEQAISMRYMLIYLGVHMRVITDLCGDNLGIIISSTNPELELKNKHVTISYHKLREIAAAGTFNPIKVCMPVNQYDILKSITSVGTLVSLSNASYGVYWR